MIHLRLVSPSDLTEKVVGLLSGDPGVLNPVVLPGRACNPDGDAIECDVLGGTANTVLPSLRRLQVGHPKWPGSHAVTVPQRYADPSASSIVQAPPTPGSIITSCLPGGEYPSGHQVPISAV